MEMVNDILISLRKIIRAMDLHSKHLMKISGLTTAQLLLMQTIKKNDGVTIGFLAGSIHLSQATVTTILDRLEERHLVERQSSAEDKRRVHVRLTANGEKALADAPAPLQTRFVEQVSKLNDWEQTTLLSNLQRIATMMEADDIDAAAVMDVSENLGHGIAQSKTAA